MPLPADLTESALAEWLRAIYDATAGGGRRSTYHCDPVLAAQARAVRSLVEAKVRDAVFICNSDPDCDTIHESNEIVVQVMGAP